MRFGSFNKYKNNKTEVDGIVFHSRKEADRYMELKLLLNQEEIIDLKTQFKFELIPTFKDSTGKTHRGVSYYADFVYIDPKKLGLIVEDVKGMKTDLYSLKKKLLLYKHKNIHFIET